MEFNEKLNILMETFGVTNIQLASAISVDASLISRWRSGQRIPSRKNDYPSSIASFFVSRADKLSRKAALMEILKLPYDLTFDQISLMKYLHKWLDSERSINESTVENILTKVQNYGKASKREPVPPFTPIIPPGSVHPTESYYGIAGKQAGVLEFLNHVLKNPFPVTLLLYSDESMDWLSGDPDYFRQWQYMTMQLLQKGHRIRVIHTLQRDLAEMLDAIDYWIPLYMTGSIEPFYFPRYREQIFRRTLFIAPGIAAFTSLSLPETSNQAVNQLIIDPEHIQSLTNEYNRFMAYCRPLIRVLTGDGLSDYPNLRTELEEQPGRMITSGVFPSSLTIPEALLPDLLPRETVDPRRILNLHHHRTQQFHRAIEKYDYSEILFTDYSGALLQSSPYSDFSLNYFADNLHYTREHLHIHINHIISLLKKNPRFHYYVIPRSQIGSVHITAIDNVGVIFQKTDHPHIAFAFNQLKLTTSFFYYLESMIENSLHEKHSRELMISHLEDLAK